MRTKKFLSLVLSICLLGTVLSGCSSKKFDPNHPVTLNMWHNYGGDMQESMDILIDQFNSTIGKEKGILINVTAISSSSELSNSLDMILNDDPGAPNMPDIFTGYPKEAIKFQQKGLLAKLDNYINSDELSKYVDSFIAEGRLGDNGLYVFPIAKSTEVLYVNQTLFDKFATETGVSIENLSTFEGIAELSEKYYSWTDSMTPNKKNDGKYFFTADSWFNVAEVGMAQLDDTIFNNDSISLKSNNYKYMFDNFYEPITQGGIAVYDGYSSDLSKTGDLVCSTGSSAGILFYGDTITHPDGSVENVEYSILPYPVFKSGKNIALQRGGGLMVAKSTEQKEYAACEFIKWLTASEQNMKFIEKTGYLPVTKQAFETDISSRLEGLKDERIKKMLATVLSMYENYEFFTAPTYASFDSDSENYEKQYKKIMRAEQKNKLKGKKTSSKKAYVLLTK